MTSFSFSTRISTFECKHTTNNSFSTKNFLSTAQRIFSFCTRPKGLVKIIFHVQTVNKTEKNGGKTELRLKNPMEIIKRVYQQQWLRSSPLQMNSFIAKDLPRLRQKKKKLRSVMKVYKWGKWVEEGWRDIEIGRERERERVWDANRYFKMRNLRENLFMKKICKMFYFLSSVVQRFQFIITCKCGRYRIKLELQGSSVAQTWIWDKSNVVLLLVLSHLNDTFILNL